MPRKLDVNDTLPLNLILCILYRISALDLIPRELDRNETIPLNLILCILYRISALDVNETIPLNLILCILYRISALDVIPLSWMGMRRGCLSLNCLSTIESLLWT